MGDKLHGPVVVGVDGSDEAMCAADYGAWDAERRRVPLRLVYARRPAPLWGPSNVVIDEYSWERDWVRALLTRTKSDLADAHPDVRIEAVAASGGAAGVLVAESAGASLVVLGTRAAGGFRGHLSASVAVQVAAHAASPVIAVRGIAGRRCDRSAIEGRRVVVGVDGSLPSAAAIRFAVEQAVARDADVHAVLVWSLFDVHDEGPIVPADFDEGEEQEKSDRLLDEAMSGWRDRYPELRISRRAVHDLDPVEVLVEESHHAGLVVVGSRGHGGFLGLMLGSTVDGLIRNSHTPVAVVHSEDEV